MKEATRRKNLDVSKQKIADRLLLKPLCER